MLLYGEYAPFFSVQLLYVFIKLSPFSLFSHCDVILGCGFGLLLVLVTKNSVLLPPWLLKELQVIGSMHGIDATYDWEWTILVIFHQEGLPSVNVSRCLTYCVT